MSQWTDRIRHHRIWELLKTVGPTIDNAQKRESLTPEAIDSLERLGAVLTVCGKRVASADPTLIPPAAVENLANTLAALKTHVETFTSNGDMAQLSAANTQADNALTHLAIVPGTATPDDLTIISELAASYRSTLEKYLTDALNTQNTLTERGKINEDKIAALETALTAEQQRLATLATEQQSEFSKAQDRRATDFSATQNDHLSKFTASATGFQTQFSADQEARKTAFSEFQRSASDDVAKLVASYTKQLSEHDKTYAEKEQKAIDAHLDKLQELQDSYSTKASEILGQIEVNKKNVEDLVGVIGNLGVTSGYQKVANHARAMLYVWQTLTVIALAGLIGVAIVVALLPIENLPGKDLGTAHVPLASNAQPNQQRALENKGDFGKADNSTRADAKNGTQAEISTPSDSSFYHGLATRIFLAITFGIFAGYAGRQASHFMEIEKKNRKLALELEALGPFIEPLKQEDRDKFRVLVGDRSFGVQDHDGSRNKKEDDPVTLLALLKSKDIQDYLADFVKDKLK
jgi:hypothetical protein